MSGAGGSVLYAIGDIHGELELLDELLASLPHRPGDRLVFMGDYVDRGPDAKGVVDRLIALARERECVFLLGNHESMFLDFLGWRGPEYFAGDAFLMNGGDRTLASYGYFELDEPDQHHFRLPKAHEDFYRSLRLFHLEGDYLFVHAGIGRDRLEDDDVHQALRRANNEDLLWDSTSIDMQNSIGVTIV